MDCPEGYGSHEKGTYSLQARVPRRCAADENGNDEHVREVGTERYRFVVIERCWALACQGEDDVRHRAAQERNPKDQYSSSKGRGKIQNAEKRVFSVK